MDPNGNTPAPQNPLPGQPPVIPPSSGSDWQKEAVAAARAGAQPAVPPSNPAVNPGVNPGVAASGIPDWQRGFQHPAAPKGQDVPDMLAPADPVSAPAPPPPLPPSRPLPQLPQLPESPEVNPTPGARYGQPVVSAAFSPDPQAPSAMEPGGPKSAKKIFIIVGAVAAVIVLAAIAYFVVFAGNGSDSVKDANEESNNSAAGSAIDLSLVSDVTFASPDLTGYTQDAASSSDTYTTYTNGDKTCALGFGTVPAGTFSGSTVEEMVDAQVQAVRKLGATADGPHAAEALVLKSGSNPNITYKMPTLSFTFTKDGASGKVLYSIVTLKDKRLAIVNRQCGNQNGSVTDAALDAVDKKARELLVGVGQGH